MAHINLEILFYLIWTKLLVWTRCPQQVGTQPPQPRWARSGSQICHCDHGLHMNPWFFNSSPFMQQIRSTSLLSLDSILYPQTVSQETPDVLLRLSCFLACVRKNEKKAKENRECVKNKKWKMNINCSYPKSNYLDVVWYQSALCWRSWILKLEQRCWLIAWSSASKTCGFLCLGAKANTTFHCCSEEFKGVNVHTARKPINSSSPRSDTVLTQKFHWTLHKDIQET